MSTGKMLFLGVALLGLSACAKDTFITHTGNMPSAEKVEQLKNGMTRSEVRNLLGSPSSVVTLDRDTWIYMSSEIEQIAFMRPEEIDRQLLVVKFNTDGKVANIEHLDQSEGKQLAVSEQKTNAPEQEQGFFRKYFGGVGQISPFGSSGNIDE